MDDLVAVLRAAGEPNRLRILALCSDGDLSVSELTRILGQSQPGVSRHLRLLCEAGLLERHQEGSWAFFHLPATGPCADIARFLVARVDENDAMIARDRRRLAEIKQERAARSEAYFRQNAAQWDRIRALHVDEVEVEAAVRDLVGTASVEALLDVGTGTGRMLHVLADSAQVAIGVDRSRDMLAVARANLSDARFGNCSVRQGDMYDLPFDAPAFDLVVLHMVLHFADRPRDAIGEAARVTRPGGHVLVVDFAPHDMEALRDEHAHRRLGFRSEEIETWSQVHGLTVDATRSLPGERLTVTIWKLRRDADVRDLAVTAPAREIMQ
ncbi:MAG: ArsR family transcriptional regulator [Alphaproteobacteria bacterium]|nr:ArsR family transcriptional regulator [Alphaproteobacteria bacterium]